MDVCLFGVFEFGDCGAGVWVVFLWARVEEVESACEDVLSRVGGWGSEEGAFCNISVGVGGVYAS